MVRIHREPPIREGPPGGAVPYKHFGARLARLDRFDSCTLHQVCAGSSTDQNSWPTPNKCGFNSRTAHQAGLARRASPRSIIARCWFDSNILHQDFMGDWQRRLMHLPLKRDQAGSIPAGSPARAVFARWGRAAPTKVLRDWQMRLCTRLLSETKRVRFLHPAPSRVRGRFIQLDQDRAF